MGTPMINFHLESEAVELARDRPWKGARVQQLHARPCMHCARVKRGKVGMPLAVFAPSSAGLGSIKVHVSPGGNARASLRINSRPARAMAAPETRLRQTGTHAGRTGETVASGRSGGRCEQVEKKKTLARPESPGRIKWAPERTSPCPQHVVKGVLHWTHGGWWNVHLAPCAPMLRASSGVAS